MRWLWQTLGFRGYDTRKNSEEEVRAMNGFCLQFDNLVKSGEFSGGPRSHLSCELNSKLTPLEGKGWKKGWAKLLALWEETWSVSQKVRSIFLPPGSPTFISHNSLCWNLACGAIISFPCDSPEIRFLHIIAKASCTVL